MTPSDVRMRRNAFPEILGQVLREFRMDAQLSQERLAFAASVTKNYISDLETGRRNATMRIIAQILQATGVTWEEFGKRVDRAAAQRSSSRKHSDSTEIAKASTAKH